MTWPRGKSRREFNKQKEAVAKESTDLAERAAPLESAEIRERPRMEARPKPAKKTWQMRAGNNWEGGIADAEESPDRYHISRDQFPAGMDLQWWTRTIRGQDIRDRVIIAERGGWTAVHTDDFDGWHKTTLGNRFPLDDGGFITLDGMGLFARPEEISARAKKRQDAAAREAIALKEQAFKGGEMNATGANHPSALATNKINRTMERIEVPRDE